MNRKKQKDLKITALYCRLSLEDGKDNESMSISNQKLMLKDYAEKNGLFSYEYYVEIKLAYLIQKAETKYRRNRRNKGFRNVECDRKPFSFCGKLYSCEKRCLEVNPPHRHLNPLVAKSKGSELSCVYSLFTKNPSRELDFVRFSVYN